jgi:hypothetical protein
MYFDLLFIWCTGLSYCAKADRAVIRSFGSTMSTSTTRRRSTVHDFSTLRLHPDGSRVAINSPTRTGPRDSRTRNTGRDTRGNRVARDAAGLGVIPKRTVIREDDDDDNNDDGDEDDLRNIKPRMPLRRKRRRIEDDIEFLGDSGSGARRTAIANGEATNWPVPSSVRSSRSSFPLWDHTLTVHRTC